MKRIRPPFPGLPHIHDTEMMRTIMLFFLFVLVGLRFAMLNIEKEEGLAPESKKYLLNLARQTLICSLQGQELPKPAAGDLSAAVRRKAGCFVTLVNTYTGLRGCIGIFERNEPLYKNVISRAIAASRDSRFMDNPVSFAEMKDIRIEVSVLSEPRNLKFSSPEDLLSKLRPGVDGVILVTPYGTSTYLPQVWASFSGKDAFLSSLCEKHGAPADTWIKDCRKIKVQTYQAEVFGE